MRAVYFTAPAMVNPAAGMTSAFVSVPFVVVRLSLLLMAFFALLLAAMHVGTPENIAAADFGDCSAMPCWQGVQPGITPRAAAIDGLKAGGWTLREQCNPAVYQACYSFSRAATDPIAFLYVDQEVVRQIALVRNRLRLGDLWLALGSPETSAIAPRSYRASWLNAALWFDPANVSTRMKFACPLGFSNMLLKEIDTILVWEAGTAMRGTTLDSPADLRRAVFEVCG
jgi:hypothetical protein